jgi:hypothetical protein
VARIPTLAGVLAVEVKDGRMDVTTALQRIAGACVDAARRELGAPGLDVTTG